VVRRWQTGGCTCITFFRLTPGARQGAALFNLHPKDLAIMKINIGTLDRILRIVAGLVLIALAATGTVGWWGWLGVVPLATGLFRFCPAYTLLGINTCPLKR
jgi:hypothetical protein